MARIVVGVTGGIAAYKTVTLVRQLVRAGHEVHVVPTTSALRFVGGPTWEAISHQPVTTDVFDDVATVRHVALGQSADLIVIAPATANSIAKLAHGLADDLLGTTVLASSAPLLVAPAMHTEMWENPATRANIDLLRERGIATVGPMSGPLTGDDVGVGRMAEPEQIFEAAMQLLAPHGHDYAGVRMVISAGSTREHIDPVRYLGNHSSGRQGLAIAAAARARGADVTVVLGISSAEIPAGIRIVRAETAERMRLAMLEESSNADVVVMAAAVADYRAAEVASTKIRKSETGDDWQLRLIANPDILAELVRERRPGQRIVGFAAETAPDDAALISQGRAKLARKGCDLLVLNRVVPNEAGVGEVFGSPTTTVHLVRADAMTSRDASGTKLSVAHAILDELVTIPTTPETTP